MFRHSWFSEIEGSIVGIATGTPGDFSLNIYQNIQPDIERLDPDYALKL